MNINGLIEINGFVMHKLMLDAGWRKFIDFCGYKVRVLVNAESRLIRMVLRGIVVVVGERFGRLFRNERIDVAFAKLFCQGL